MECISIEIGGKAALSGQYCTQAEPLSNIRLCLSGQSNKRVDLRLVRSTCRLGESPPVFCTIDASSELLTTFLHLSRNPDDEDWFDEEDNNPAFGTVILRRIEDVSASEEPTPVPMTSLPDPITPTPFKDWTPKQCWDFLAAHAPFKHVNANLFVILDERSTRDCSVWVCKVVQPDEGCEISVSDGDEVDGTAEALEKQSLAAKAYYGGGEVGEAKGKLELAMVRVNMRDVGSILCNFLIGNMDMYEFQDSAKAAKDGVCDFSGRNRRQEDIEMMRVAKWVLKPDEIRWKKSE